MKKVVQQRKDIAFFIKMFPLKMHKDSYWKANSIVCRKSLKMLEDNYEGKPIERADCAAKQIDASIKLADSLGVNSTPTLILPDGRMHAGAMPADKLIELIDGRK